MKQKWPKGEGVYHLAPEGWWEKEREDLEKFTVTLLEEYLRRMSVVSEIERREAEN